MGYLKRNNGITLISLIVTIIVLLILVGISVSMITKESGILERVSKTKEETEQAEEKESSILSDYETKLNEYAGIDWDVVLKNVTKHPDQITSTAIGVGTDGKVVNMDLWTYQLEDETCKIEYSSNKSDIVNGRIKGTIPQYIKIDNQFYNVTNLSNCFINNTNLIYAPLIPSTVKYMNGTFAYCSLLENVSVIPDGVLELTSTFAGCTSLKYITNLPENLVKMSSTFLNCTSLSNIPNIPKNVENMNNAFNGCSKLEKVPNIPNKVTTMIATFASCTNLKQAPAIPENVTVCYSLFENCTNLSGVLEINANLTGKIVTGVIFDYTHILWNATIGDSTTLKVKGSCPMISEIVEEAKNSKITL